MPYLPELVISPDPDGGYVLLANTEVPSIAYTAGQACEGEPPSTVSLPGAVSVVLPILSKAGAAANLSSPATVRHRLAGMHLQPGTMVQAYVTVNGAVHGQASVFVPAVAAAIQVFCAPSLYGGKWLCGRFRCGLFTCGHCDHALPGKCK